MPPSAASLRSVSVPVLLPGDPECWGARSSAPGQAGKALPDGGVSHVAPSPLGGMAGAGGAQWYPDLVPNNLVLCSYVPINFLTAVENKKNIDIGWLRNYMAVVGTGAPKEFCGNVRSLVAACQNKPGEHEPVFIPQTCGRRICDECWTTWAIRASKRVADVLNGYLNAKMGDVTTFDSDEIERALPRHISFHPPDYVLDQLVLETKKECDHEWQFPSKFLRKFRKLAEEILLSAGVQAAVLIPHEIRLKDELRTDNELEINRYRSVLKYKNWIYKIKYYPHVHSLVFGMIENAAAFHARTGWTYRNHSQRKMPDGSYRLNPIRNPEGLVYYLLSHAPATGGVHNITYLGELSNRRLVKIGERIFRIPDECGQCKDEGVLSDYNRVISYLHKETLKFENDGNKDALLRFGRGKPVLWGFDTITDRIYFKSERIGEYRLLAPGTRWKKPRWKHTGLDKESLEWLRIEGKDDNEQGWWFLEGEPVDRHDVDLEYLEADGGIKLNWFMYGGSGLFLEVDA
jgi:hypothetical protein